MIPLRGLEGEAIEDAGAQHCLMTGGVVQEDSPRLGILRGSSAKSSALSYRTGVVGCGPLVAPALPRPERAAGREAGYRSA